MTTYIEKVAPKLVNIILYICERMKDAKHFDDAKLNLILWEIDSGWYLRTGKPLTEAVYIKGPDGPIACVEIEGILAGL